MNFFELVKFISKFPKGEPEVCAWVVLTKVLLCNHDLLLDSVQVLSQSGDLPPVSCM
jgi:hypothetical protein